MHNGTLFPPGVGDRAGAAAAATSPPRRAPTGRRGGRDPAGPPSRGRGTPVGSSSYVRFPPLFSKFPRLTEAVPSSSFLRVWQLHTFRSKWL